MPLVVMFGLGTIKEAAVAGAMFVWVNSLAGLIARHNSGTFDVRFISPLIIAVVIGGFSGSYFGSTKFEPQSIQKIITCPNAYSYGGEGGIRTLDTG